MSKITPNLGLSFKDEKKTEEKTNVKVIPNQPDEHPLLRINKGS